MSDFRPMTECKGFNMERVLLKNKNGYMITAYFKDGMLQCDGDENWTHPIAWKGFIRLQDLANGATTGEEQCNLPVVSVAKHSLPRPLEYWNKAQELDCGDYIEWHLEKECGNAH